MLDNKQTGLSLAFEGIFALGKSTLMRKLINFVDPSIESVWLGHGHHFSIRKGQEQGLSLQEWTARKLMLFQEIEKDTNLLLIEGCTFGDFSNMCFRKNLVAAEELWAMNQVWWPDYTIVIKVPIELSIERLKIRGDTYRINTEDLEEFNRAIEESIHFLNPLLKERLIIAGTPEEAYETALRIMEESAWSMKGL
jgi:thymidylate kinase